MSFKKVFRGYDPKQVDAHIVQLNQKHEQVRLAQKQYLEELTEENYQLRQQVKQYKLDEQAIAKSLVDSQKLAEELKNDAVRFSELVLTRAKVFYAAWHTYSQTLIATLDEKEVIEFNKVMAKIENIINAYEGANVLEQSQKIVQQARQEQTAMQQSPATQNPTVEQVATTVVEQPIASATADTPVVESADLAPTSKTMGVFVNPIGKVEQAASQNVIDLRELTVVESSLEDICAELGLIPPKNDDQPIDDESQE